MAKLGNIQCESCHGPQPASHSAASAGRQTVNMGMCGQCHDAPTHHDFPNEWARTPHSDVEFAREEGTYEKRTTSAGHCGRCHASQGFLSYSERLEAGNPNTIVCVPPSGSGTCTSTEAQNFFTAMGLVDATVEPITCQTCHDPHDNTNPNQLRVYDEIPLLPSGFGVEGVGKGAICMACHNTRNGMNSSLLPYLHDDYGPALTSYSGPHYSAQTDVLMGYNAYFVGRGGYAISNHGAIGDTCVSCHMAESEDGGMTGAHSWKLNEELCVSCHGEGVTGEGTQAMFEMRVLDLQDVIATEVLGVIDAAVTEGGFTIRAWNPVTDCYSSSSSSTSNVVVNQVPTDIGFEHIHGQTGFRITVGIPVSVTWAGTGCSGTENLTDLYFQVGSLKNAAASATLIAYADVLVKAFWNLGLMESDGSFGIHNPTWSFDVLENTYQAVVTRP